MEKFRVEAIYVDPDIQVKNAKKEPHDIVFASANYNLSIYAEDMKKAIDIANQYMPVGAMIRNIYNESGPIGYLAPCPCPEPY